MVRTQKDRIRHTIMFEALAIAIAAPLFSVISDRGLVETGALTLGLSALAMLWNYVYNILFDQIMVAKGIVHRTFKIRLMHAALFEVGLLIAMLPVVAWWMQISLWQALILDIGFAVFFMAYAFAFNWAYDMVFPVKTNEATVQTQDTF